MPRLPKCRLNTTARSIGELVHQIQAGELDLDAPYQRGHVWGPIRRQQLMRSVFCRVPVSSIIINDRLGGDFVDDNYAADRDPAYVVVDGKQRLTTFAMFMDDELSLPAEWFTDAEVEDTDAGVSVVWSQLTTVTQRSFARLPVAVEEAALTTVAAERELFDLINFGGLAQGDVDDDATARSTQAVRRG